MLREKAGYFNLVVSTNRVSSGGAPKLSRSPSSYNVILQSYLVVLLSIISTFKDVRAKPSALLLCAQKSHYNAEIIKVVKLSFVT